MQRPWVSRSKALSRWRRRTQSDTKPDCGREDPGNAAYKLKDFKEAHKHYDKAIELDPSNITFYTNKAAAYFEEHKYDDCVEICKKAVEIGREQRADFKLIAKTMARAGNAYSKAGDLKEALNWYEKSVSEFRDPETVKKAKELEKEIKERERVAYINPEIAQEEKNLGNEKFKNGDYPGAMKHYNEAVKRDPDNAVLYSNRAACYTKLMEFQRALDDCENCIKRDPKFIKGYIRKGAVLTAMREWTKAKRAYEDALTIDPSNVEAIEGLRNCFRSNDEDPEKARERALEDPEMQAILRDPGMRLLLEQMSEDPGAVREHLQNPDIAAKLLKLREAGIIQMR
ncbi:Hsp90 cochaperone [Parelaphostrongylus tenuis]|uniref:Stress-induced-phosphoprotein 1 n=1 Tax=Parelaphostrongylus tenuis TaxID=148309 RepID=A0AAD5N838_PARTN|nr:Hsp90 cochaperone [Parelaphostrongylus tenuis]